MMYVSALNESVLCPIPACQYLIKLIGTIIGVEIFLLEFMKQHRSYSYPY